MRFWVKDLSRRFLTVRGAAFGRGSRVLWPFLEKCATSMEMVYLLANGGHRTFANHLGSVTERPNTIEECKFIGAEYVQWVVDALNNNTGFVKSAHKHVHFLGDYFLIFYSQLLE